ncbi:MAG: hypothetical protein NO516_02205 [Candidatus Methanomethylicia archaeon]|nr:hypothetical protein [Candidatus Methanomethylicia archaeon]
MEFGWLIDLVGMAFNGLRWAISQILELTLFKTNPTLVDNFASTISLLITLTAIYIMLIFVASAKKILGIILALGWGLLIVSLFLSAI